MNECALREIWSKTNGHCHFCGDAIRFENRGWAVVPKGHWEVDHVIQRDKGGAKATENCLPACTRCNRLRWHRTGEGIRDLLLLGVIAVKEIKKGSIIGRELERLKEARLEDNLTRRVKGDAARNSDTRSRRLTRSARQEGRIRQ